MLEVGSGAAADVFVFTDGRDTITDLTRSQGDRVELSSELWNGDLTAAQVVRRFGAVVDGDLVLTFGRADVLVLADVSSMSAAIAMIDIV